MLNILDVKTEAILAELIRRYIDQEHLELEHRGEPEVTSEAAPNLNSCVLLVGIGNQGAKTVSQIMRQLNKIGIVSEDYLGLALVDAIFPERDDQIEYIVMEENAIPRNRVRQKLLEKKDDIIGTLEVLNTRLTNVISRTSANIKIYVVSDLSEDLFAGCSILTCLLEDKLNGYFVANTGVEFTGLFFQSAMLRTQQQQAKVFASWQEISIMSSSDFKLEIDLGDLSGQRANRITCGRSIFAISYLYSDFNENFSPMLKTVEGDYSMAEMLGMLVYLKSSSQFNEARIFNSLQMPSAAVANGLPRYAAIGYSKKSIKIFPIFGEACWYLLHKIHNVNKSMTGYIIQDWEGVLNELEINNSGIEILEADYSLVKDTLKEIEELSLRLEYKVLKELQAEPLESAERLLMSDNVKLVFEERVVKVAKQITADHLPKQLEKFAKVLKGYLQNERRGLYYVKRLIKSEDENNKQCLIKYLEIKIEDLITKRDALRQKAERVSQLTLSRLEIEPDKKGLLGLGNKKNNFLRRLVEVKYELLQKAVVYEQLRETLEGYLGYSRNIYALILNQEENILSLDKALKAISDTERRKLVAAGEDGLIDLCKDQFNQNKQQDQINEALATFLRGSALAIFQENGAFLEELIKDLFENTKQLLRQTNLQTLSLEQLLESLTQTQPLKGKQMVEDLYAKCNLALSLSKGVMSRQPETHYYFFNNEGNSSLRRYIKGLFQGKPNDVFFIDYKSIKSIRMVKACFGFDLKDIYFYRNYEEAYKRFGPEP